MNEQQSQSCYFSEKTRIKMAVETQRRIYHSQIIRWLKSRIGVTLNSTYTKNEEEYFKKSNLIRDIDMFLEKINEQIPS